MTELPKWLQEKIGESMQDKMTGSEKLWHAKGFEACYKAMIERARPNGDGLRGFEMMQIASEALEKK